MKGFFRTCRCARTLAASALLAAAAYGAENIAAVKPRVPRSAIAGMEKSFDQRIYRAVTLETLDLLGTTRGVYLDNYGVVFSAEVGLYPDPARTPMQPAWTPAFIQALHAKKLERLPILKQMMREMLTNLAVALDTMPGNEQVVVAVTLFYRKLEKRDGLPEQIVMQAPRQVLLDIRDKKAAPEEIRTGEY